MGKRATTPTTPPSFLNSLLLTFIAPPSPTARPHTLPITALMQSRVVSARAGTAAPSLAARRAAPARAKCVSVRTQAAATTTKLNTSKSEAVGGVFWEVSFRVSGDGEIKELGHEMEMQAWKRSRGGEKMEFIYASVVADGHSRRRRRRSVARRFLIPYPFFFSSSSLTFSFSLSLTRSTPPPPPPLFLLDLLRGPEPPPGRGQLPRPRLQVRGRPAHHL